MKSKSYEKYREAKDKIKKGEAQLIEIDEDVSLVSTQLIKQGRNMYNNYLIQRKIINGRPN